MIKYTRLFKILLDKGMSKTELREAVGFSTTTLARMTKNEYIKMETLDKICDYLDCNIEDVIEHVSNK